METITEDLDTVDISPAARLFKGVNKSDLIRPVGPVDLLIGIHIVQIHPLFADPKKHIKGNLRMLMSQFGSGLLLDGTHKSIKPHGGKLCHLAYNLTRGVVKMPSPDIGMEP